MENKNKTRKVKIWFSSVDLIRHVEFQRELNLFWFLGGKMERHIKHWV